MCLRSVVRCRAVVRLQATVRDGAANASTWAWESTTPKRAKEVRFRVPKIQELALYGGVHGFKGPLDRSATAATSASRKVLTPVPRCRCARVGLPARLPGRREPIERRQGQQHRRIRITQQFWTAGLFKRTRERLAGRPGLRHDVRRAVELQRLRAAPRRDQLCGVWHSRSSALPAQCT